MLKLNVLFGKDVDLMCEIFKIYLSLVFFPPSSKRIFIDDNVNSRVWKASVIIPLQMTVSSVEKAWADTTISYVFPVVECNLNEWRMINFYSDLSRPALFNRWGWHLQSDHHLTKINDLFYKRGRLHSVGQT